MLLLASTAKINICAKPEPSEKAMVSSLIAWFQPMRAQGKPCKITNDRDPGCDRNSDDDDVR